jgi:hypothetical protein
MRPLWSSWLALAPPAAEEDEAEERGECRVMGRRELFQKGNIIKYQTNHYFLYVKGAE